MQTPWPNPCIVSFPHTLSQVLSHRSGSYTKSVQIPKSGNLLGVKNHRPISLPSIVSKVLERIIFNKIIDFLRPKFSKQQFGFQKNKSSLSQLLSSFAYILEEIDKGSTVDMIFLDLKKAFDTVPHEELLFKLWNIGITGPHGIGLNRLHCYLFFRVYLREASLDQYFFLFISMIYLNRSIMPPVTSLLTTLS